MELLIHNALHDPLTKLPNRTLLEKRIELAIHRAKPVETYHYVVLFLDLDRFKVIGSTGLSMLNWREQGTGRMSDINDFKDFRNISKTIVKY